MTQMSRRRMRRFKQENAEASAEERDFTNNHNDNNHLTERADDEKHMPKHEDKTLDEELSFRTPSSLKKKGKKIKSLKRSSLPAASLSVLKKRKREPEIAANFDLLSLEANDGSQTQHISKKRKKKLDVSSNSAVMFDK